MELTWFDKQALEAVRCSADIFDKGTAVILRGLESEGFVKIGKPFGGYDDAGVSPYFGAITTNKGLGPLNGNEFSEKG